VAPGILVRRSDNGCVESRETAIHDPFHYRGATPHPFFLWESIMHRPGIFFAFLLSLSARPVEAHPGLDRVPATQVVTLATSAQGEAAGPQQQEWFHIYGTLNVRAEPRQGASVVRTLHRGDYVQLGPKDANGWARLYSAGSPEGYVYRASELVQSQAPAVQAAMSAPRGSDGGSRRSSAAGRVYHTGPRGGCYYYTGSGRKEYVDRSNCR
jgi:hypothetical protein